MRFWDSSAIVPLLVDEPRTQMLHNLIKSDPQTVVWWTTPIEVVSALARLSREDQITPEELTAMIGMLRNVTDACTIVEPQDALLTLAQRLLLAHPLRAADALQLSAALATVSEQPYEMPFVCLDKRLRDAALREGFEVLPVNGIMS